MQNINNLTCITRNTANCFPNRHILQMEELMKIVYKWGTKCRFFENKVALSLAKTNKSDRTSHCFRLPEDPLESLWIFLHSKFVCCQYISVLSTVALWQLQRKWKVLRNTWGRTRFLAPNTVWSAFGNCRSLWAECYCYKRLSVS